MNDGSPQDHRRRYRALDDRRRLGFELERLWATLERHPAWPERSLPARRGLAVTLSMPHHRPDADAARIEDDVRELTARIVTLAKALRALDTGEPLPDPIAPDAR
jgi:hypothetical protein